jgi:MerR family transcriptional regulator, redox-sensitive transcriptional activator SoxR
MDEATLSIGQVAREVGIRASAIRYYESVGVLPEPERQSGQRRYNSETIRRLQILGIAQRAGFTLDEAAVLLGTRNNGTPANDQLRALAEQKLPEVDALIARAQAMRDWLATATGCNCQTLDVSPLFDGETAIEADKAAPQLRLRHVGG